MKALLRNPGETVTENDGIVGIDWNTGAPLTNPGWSGGPYILVNDYVQTADEDFAESETVSESKIVSETVTVNGKEYTREELLALLNQTH